MNKIIINLCRTSQPKRDTEKIKRLILKKLLPYKNMGFHSLKKNIIWMF